MNDNNKIISQRVLKDNRITARLDYPSLGYFIALQKSWESSVQETIKRCIIETYQAYQEEKVNDK